VHMYLPAKTGGPWPAVLYIGPVTPKVGKDKAREMDAVRYMLEHGYAVCGFHFRDGMGMYRHYFPQHSGPWIEKGNRKVLLHGWGEMTIWAWKTRRVFEALLQRPEIDGKRIIVAGGSRYASAALLAAAYEERIAMLYCWEGVVQNRIGPINYDFFSKYTPFVEEVQKAGKHKSFPVDNHCLLATVAPRPVLFTGAASDPYGFWRYNMGHYRGARPVYEFLGETFPELAEAPKERPWKTGLYGKGPIQFLLREGTHEWVLDDWIYLVKFADMMAATRTTEGAGSR
jgi:hypothetical protein